MADVMEYWDDCVNPKPGQISIVDALRWRDDIYYINSDRLSGFKPATKKRIREDLINGKPPFSVIFESPNKKALINKLEDIPLPEEEPVAATLFVYKNVRNIDELSTLHCRVEDIPLPSEEAIEPELFVHKKSEDNDISVWTDSGFSDASSCKLLKENKIENIFQKTANWNCDSDAVEVNSDKNEDSLSELDYDYSPEMLPVPDIEPEASKISRWSEYYKECAISYSHQISFPWCQPNVVNPFLLLQSSPQSCTLNEQTFETNIEIKDQKLENFSLLVASENHHNTIHLSGINNINNAISLSSNKKDRDECISEKEDGELSDYDDSVWSHETIYTSHKNNKNLSHKFVEEEYLTDNKCITYKNKVSEIEEKEDGELSDASDEEIDETKKQLSSKTDLTEDVERDLALIIEKLEKFHFNIDNRENTSNNLVEMMSKLKLEAEKFGLPMSVIQKMDDLKLSAISDEDSSFLVKKIAEMTISLRKDLKMMKK